MIEIPPWTADDPWPDDCRRLLLIGPPGTGKTRSILTTYAWPAMRRGDALLATSYTRAAAGELRDRTARELGGMAETYRTQLSTMHSESSRRCAGLGLVGEKSAPASAGGDDEDEGESGLDPMTATLSRMESEDRSDALSAWESVRHRWPGDIGRTARERLSRVLSGQALDVAEAVVRHDLDGRLDDDGKLVRPDFTGLLELALVRGTVPNLELLVVDEAQDLTPLQWAIVDRWAGQAIRLLVVGDPDQAIYGYAGADGRRLISWANHGHPARRLAQSYRVPRAVHALARRVVRAIPGRIDAPYLPADRDGAVESAHDPADTWATLAIGAEAGRSALVLSRSRNGCAVAVAELIDAEIPHLAERGPRLLGTVDNPSRAVRIARALDACLSTSPRASAVVTDLRALVAAMRASQWKLPRGAKTALAAVLKGARGSMSLHLLADAGLPVEAIASAWADPDPRQWRDRLTMTGCPDVKGLLLVREWVLIHGAQLYPLAGRVIVTSCHGAKGREADTVVIDSRSGSRAFTPSGGPEERDEDRRVLYVAITRPKHTLVLLRNPTRSDWLSQHGL